MAYKPIAEDMFSITVNKNVALSQAYTLQHRAVNPAPETWETRWHSYGPMSKAALFLKIAEILNGPN